MTSLFLALSLFSDTSRKRRPPPFFFPSCQKNWSELFLSFKWLVVLFFSSRDPTPRFFSHLPQSLFFPFSFLRPRGKSSPPPLAVLFTFPPHTNFSRKGACFFFLRRRGSPFSPLCYSIFSGSLICLFFSFIWYTKIGFPPLFFFFSIPYCFPFFWRVL